MKQSLSPTRNVQRIQSALEALELRLLDHEVSGLGLVFGQPGLGKSMTMEKYFTDCRKYGNIRCAWLRALGIWTESSMMKAMLEALGICPKQYRKDIMFDQLKETLTTDPAMILIDEVDAMAESRKLVSLLKDIHDLSNSSIMLVGEERVDGLLRRYDSFYNRMHRAAVIHLSGHTAEDVTRVIWDRCDVSVDESVCVEIHRVVGKKSMRSVIDMIRDIEAYADINDLGRIGMKEYDTILAASARVRLKVQGHETQTKPALTVFNGAANE